MIDIKIWIPFGKENAVTREELHKITGYNDREIREMIGRERRKGHAILSSPSVSGYWQTEDIDEIERFIKALDRRRSSEAKNLIKLREKVAKARGYTFVQVRAHTRMIKGQCRDA